MRTLFFFICAISAWLIIIPHRRCPNKMYRQCFWLLFIPLFVIISFVSAAIGIHDKWYTEGLAVVFCALAASQISIRKYPNITYDIKYILSQLHTCPYMQIPFWSMIASKYYHNHGKYAEAVKYAYLGIQLIDSIEPSDLVAEPYSWIKKDPIFCHLVYTRIVDRFYEKGEHMDPDFYSALHRYRSQEPFSYSEQINKERTQYWKNRQQ